MKYIICIRYVLVLKDSKINSTQTFLHINANLATLVKVQSFFLPNNINIALYTSLALYYVWLGIHQVISYSHKGSTLLKLSFHYLI